MLSSREDLDRTNEKAPEGDRGRRETLAPPERFRNPHDTSGVRSLSPGYDQCDGSSHPSPTPSIMSLGVAHTWNSDNDDGEQDIQEVWFPGCHAVSHPYVDADVVRSSLIPFRISEEDGLLETMMLL